MKRPKETKRYCPHCKKHTIHKISAASRGRPSSFSHGSKYRARLRGLARGKGNRGRYSKPAITKWKLTGKKASKKTDFRYTCRECKKAHTQAQGIRTKRLEFV